MKKKGTKRAISGGLCASETEAQSKIMSMVEKQPTQKYEIEHRLGERKRCAGYCDVSAWCPSYQAYLKTQGGDDATD